MAYLRIRPCQQIGTNYGNPITPTYLWRIGVAQARFELNDMHWMYFLSLEDDLKTMSRYIELTDLNMAVFSIECTRLLLATCSEVDVVLKLIAGQIGQETRNLGQCRIALVEHFPHLVSSVASIPRHAILRRPWAAWSEGGQPSWWEDYNSVKHRRAEHFAKATLANVIDALAGLFLVLLVYLRKKGIDIIMPAPMLFRPDATMGSYCISPEGHLIDLRTENA